jgi:lactoylglutathione lyase
MKITHAALWTADLERSRRFYETWFGGRAGARYANPRTGFASYFVSFDDGVRLELMQMPGIAPRPDLGDAQMLGLAHLAFAVGAKADVDTLTARLREAGTRVLDGPRTTGDGYYESVVLDPDGNRIEITTG